MTVLIWNAPARHKLCKKSKFNSIEVTRDLLIGKMSKVAITQLAMELQLLKFCHDTCHQQEGQKSPKGGLRRQQ